MMHADVIRHGTYLIIWHRTLCHAGLQPGAARVFLEFLSYSSGPLPETQLSTVQVPLSLFYHLRHPTVRSKRWLGPHPALTCEKQPPCHAYGTACEPHRLN